MQRSLRVLIRAVSRGEDRVFVAQCLEFNIAVQGFTPQAAMTAFTDYLIQMRALVDDHGAKDPFTYLGYGPSKAWQAWDEAFKGVPTQLPCDEFCLIEPALAYA